MAASHIAVAVALLWQAKPKLAVFHRTSIPNAVLGYGLNILKAVQAR
jgi:hypothetical protein